MPAIVSAPSFIRFAYPLQFDRDKFWEITDAIEGMQRSTNRASTPVWRRHGGPPRETFGHFCNRVNVSKPDEGGPASSADREGATAFIWRLSESPPNGEAGLWSEGGWSLFGGNRQIATVLITGAELHLFRTGIGFLTLIIRPEWDTPIDDWLDVQHYLRFANGHRRVRIGAHQIDGAGNRAPIFPAFAGGMDALHDGQITGVPAQLIEGLLIPPSGRFSGKRWWNEPYLQGCMIPYTALLVDGINPEAIPGVVYRLRNVFHADQGNNPSLQDLALNHAGLAPYAENQWFSFSLDGAAFVAFDAPDRDDPHGQFNRVTLPGHLGGIYYLLFLLVQQQRFKLMSLSEQVANAWPAFDESHTDRELGERFRAVRSELMLFTAMGLFTQVAASEHHHAAYKRWQEIFEIERLYREVSQEIHEMHQFLDDQRRNQEEQDRQHLAVAEEASRKAFERIGFLIALIATVAVFPALGLAVLDSRENFGGSRSYWWAGTFLAVGIVVLLLAFAFVTLPRWMNRPDAAPAAQDQGETGR